jgi:hypothetical protein
MSSSTLPKQTLSSSADAGRIASQMANERPVYKDFTTPHLSLLQIKLLMPNASLAACPVRDWCDDR